MDNTRATRKICRARVLRRESLALVFFAMLFLGLVAIFFAAPVRAQDHRDGPADTRWRFKIREAVVVQSTVVTMGDLADVIGEMDERKKRELFSSELFAAPLESGKPMIINRNRLANTLRQHLGELAEQCLIPGQVVIQRGGAVFTASDLQQLVADKLAPAMSAMKGEASLREYKLPPYIFLSDAMGRVLVDLPARINPGRVSFRLVVTAPDGSKERQISANVFLDLWMNVPAVSRPVQKGEGLDPALLTTVRKNVAYLKNQVWDGTGGPWMLKQAIGEHQPIYLNMLEPLPQIRKGDKLTMVFERPGVRLEATAVALADGIIGDSIPVRNIQSDVQVLARVVDHSTVRVN